MPHRMLSPNSPRPSPGCPVAGQRRAGGPSSCGWAMPTSAPLPEALPPRKATHRANHSLPTSLSTLLALAFSWELRHSLHVQISARHKRFSKSGSAPNRIVHLGKLRVSLSGRRHIHPSWLICRVGVFM
eukprot:EG_transcript_16641